MVGSLRLKIAFSCFNCLSSLQHDKSNSSLPKEKAEEETKGLKSCKN